MQKRATVAPPMKAHENSSNSRKLIPVKASAVGWTTLTCHCRPPAIIEPERSYSMIFGAMDTT
ncbi:hypothetical protein OESDEN_23326 [Oesophagostomum dentatum]|uniref:Uncharacterized protein n=1 Tax=Oesophagostomum dentatum TaxID=61180 RepID=A0A0B1RWL0_OESDE|nr:hypothetical protein OESDEN_23326 [Oesophagostomum dentatum]